MEFKAGDLITFASIEIGKKIPISSIFVVVVAKPAHCSIRRLNADRVERVAKLNRMMRKLSSAEIVLYGS